MKNTQKQKTYKQISTRILFWELNFDVSNVEQISRFLDSVVIINKHDVLAPKQYFPSRGYANTTGNKITFCLWICYFITYFTLFTIYLITLPR